MGGRPGPDPSSQPDSCYLSLRHVNVDVGSPPGAHDILRSSTWKFSGPSSSQLLAGLIIGPLARLVIPGKQDVSLGMTILLGAVGALVGGLIWGLLGGGDTPGIDWIELVIQVAVAAVVIILYLNTQDGRTSA